MTRAGRSRKAAGGSERYRTTTASFFQNFHHILREFTLDRRIQIRPVEETIHKSGSFGILPGIRSGIGRCQVQDNADFSVFSAFTECPDGFCAGQIDVVDNLCGFFSLAGILRIVKSVRILVGSCQQRSTDRGMVWKTSRKCHGQMVSSPEE